MNPLLKKIPGQRIHLYARHFQGLQIHKFRGVIRSDHVPTMAGETNDQPGYEMKGNLFNVGYIKGIMESTGIHLNGFG